MPRKNSAAALAIENQKLRDQLAALKAKEEGRIAEEDAALAEAEARADKAMQDIQASEDRANAANAAFIAEVEKKHKMSGTVTVACKVPCGLQLQLQHKMSVRVPTGRGSANDYVLDESWVKGGKIYHVFGPAMPAMGGRPSGYELPPALEGGYALTHGIPADFWAQWLEQNKHAAYVENKMIFALDKASTKAKARELDELSSGLEPISQDFDKNGRMKDRRVPKPITGSVARLAHDVERDAERKGQSLAEAD